MVFSFFTVILKFPVRDSSSPWCRTLISSRSRNFLISSQSRTFKDLLFGISAIYGYRDIPAHYECNSMWSVQLWMTYFKKSYEFVYILQPAADCYCVIVCKMRTVLNVSRYWLRGFYQIRIYLEWNKIKVLWILHTKYNKL